MDLWHHQLEGATNPARDAGWPDPPPRKGFFTDTTICIGCKACEVACKEWNAIPEDGLAMSGHSYDNTVALGASTWRHVAFVEQGADDIARARESGRRLVALGMPQLREDVGSADVLSRQARSGNQALGEVRSGEREASENGPSDLAAVGRAGAGSKATAGTQATAGSGATTVAAGPPHADPGARAGQPPLSGAALDDAVAAAQAAQAMGSVPDFRWLMASDVCKHCTHAACLDVCPTGALFRTEFGTVVVQADVCNGCGYCVGACPFGVIERRDGDKTVKNANNAQKCTLCYDRLHAGAQPACAHACPTTSIQFGDLDELRERARDRVQTLHENGFTEARLYGANPGDGVGGTGSIFLLLDEPEVYGLPPDPVVTTADLPRMFRSAGYAAVAMIGAAALAFLGRRS
ncbi:MAG: 4Fe-4S dicluster domain-containing protein [Actinomycetales bacterium]